MLVISFFIVIYRKYCVYFFYSWEGILFSMGRKTANSFTEVTIAFKEDSEFKLFEVKLPHWLEVEYSLPLNEAGHMGTTSKSIHEDYKEQMINQVEQLGGKVLNIRPLVTKLPDICTQCKKKGIPKIEKKNSNDYRTKTARYGVPKSSFLGQEEKSEPIEKVPIFYLSYMHEEGKKCWIQQYIPLPYPSFKKNTKKQLDIQKHFFPYCIEWMKTS